MVFLPKFFSAKKLIIFSVPIVLLQQQVQCQSLRREQKIVTVFSLVRHDQDRLVHYFLQGKQSFFKKDNEHKPFFIYSFKHI